MVTKKSDEGIVVMGDTMRRQSLVYGERTHLVKFYLEEGSHVLPHAHPHEQTGYLLKGKMRMTIDNQGHDLQPGDSWSIRPDVSHEVTVLEAAVVLELFSPPREDYL